MSPGGGQGRPAPPARRPAARHLLGAQPDAQQPCRNRVCTMLRSSRSPAAPLVDQRSTAAGCVGAGCRVRSLCASVAVPSVPDPTWWPPRALPALQHCGVPERVIATTRRTRRGRTPRRSGVSRRTGGLGQLGSTAHEPRGAAAEQQHPLPGAARRRIAGRAGRVPVAGWLGFPSCRSCGRLCRSVRPQAVAHNRAIWLTFPHRG